MENLYIFSLKFITIIIGFAASAIAYLYYFQFKKPSALYFGCFLTGLFQIHVGEWTFYMRNIIPDFYNLPGNLFFRILIYPCYFFISYFGIKFTLSLFGKRMNKIINILILSYFIIELISYLLGFNFSKHPYNIIVIILASMVMAFFLLNGYRNIVDKYLKRSVLTFIIISFMFLPTLLLFFFEKYDSLINILTYTYYLILSVGSIFFGYYFFARKPYMIGGRPTKDFTEKYKITQRELDVIEGIIKGKTTREISDELCISSRTVTTHLSNIYGKVNVNSRVQLVNLFGSNWSK